MSMLNYLTLTVYSYVLLIFAFDIYGFCTFIWHLNIEKTIKFGCLKSRNTTDKL